MPWSGFAGKVVGSVGSLLGGTLDAHYSRENTRMAQAFQREVLQNQLQWRAADAKKAGLHPLAALGTSAASGAVGTAGVGSTFSDALGKLGEGIGDAYAAYKTKDEIAAETAKKQEREDKLFDAQLREIESRIYLNNSSAVESARRALSYTKPMATGFEVMPGQTDSPSMQRTGKWMETLNKYAWPIYPDGSRADPVPSSELSEAYENAPGMFAYTPFIDAVIDKWRAIIDGTPIDGYYHDYRTNRWTRTRPPKNPLIFWR